MASTNFQNIRQKDQPTVNEDAETNGQASTGSPVFRSVGTSGREQDARGPNPAANSAFTVLRVTAFQQALGHPVTYARVLMQLGYEPLPAYRGKTLFGKENLFYPNVFRYLKYIYQIDGISGLYRGFGCAVLSKMVGWYTANKVDKMLGPVDTTTSNEEAKPTLNLFIKKTLREVHCQSWGILISHPFQVMSIRCMAQFIGREKVYSSMNIFQNFQAVYKEQGIGGLFIGFMPRWLLEIVTIIISNMVIYMLKSQLPSQNELTPLYEYMAAFIAQTVTYPLNVVATVAAVNRCGLRAGTIPITPIYANWQDAYEQLGKAEQLKRGSSFFNRVVTGRTSIPALGKLNPSA